jgi:hypothetical protein
MHEPTDRDVIVEPPNSTVDDWFGQNVARDQDVADRVAEEAPDGAEAERRYEEEADGRRRYQDGHRRPDAGGERS